MRILQMLDRGGNDYLSITAFQEWKPVMI